MVLPLPISTLARLLMLIVDAMSRMNVEDLFKGFDGSLLFTNPLVRFGPMSSVSNSMRVSFEF